MQSVQLATSRICTLGGARKRELVAGSSIFGAITGASSYWWYREVTHRTLHFCCVLANTVLQWSHPSSDSTRLTALVELTANCEQGVLELLVSLWRVVRTPIWKFASFRPTWMANLNTDTWWTYHADFCFELTFVLPRNTYTCTSIPMTSRIACPGRLMTRLLHGWKEHPVDISGRVCVRSAVGHIDHRGQPDP